MHQNGIAVCTYYIHRKLLHVIYLTQIICMYCIHCLPCDIKCLCHSSLSYCGVYYVIDHSGFGTKHGHTTIKYRSYKGIDIDSFLADLEAVQWSVIV